MKIRFKINHRPKGDAADIPSYKAGDVHDLELSYASKYIRLGYAEEAVDLPPVADPEPGVETIFEDVPEIVDQFGREPVEAPVVDFQRRPGKYRK